MGEIRSKGLKTVSQEINLGTWAPKGKCRLTRNGNSPSQGTFQRRRYPTKAD